jgi:DNA polymerase-3 subunit delta
VARKGPTYADLRRALKSDPPPVIVLYGEEDYLIQELQEEVIAKALGDQDRSFNLDVLYGTDAGGADLVARASAFPMMADRRVVVVRDVDHLGKDDLELLAEYVKKPSPTTVFVMTGAKVDFRKKAFSAVATLGHAYVCAPLYERDAVEWVHKAAQKDSRTIDDDAAAMLVARVGTSLRELRNELDKLYLFAGDRARLTADDVTHLVGQSREVSPFELQKAIGEKNAALALWIADRLLEGGEKIPGLVAILSRFFSLVWKLHSLSAGRGRGGGDDSGYAAEMGIPAFFMRDYRVAVDHFTMDEIESAFLHLSRVDAQSKTTGADQHLLMTGLIIRLCSPEGNFVRHSEVP